MRSLAIILLLLLAVACDADSGDGTEQAAAPRALPATVVAPMETAAVGVVVTERTGLDSTPGPATATVAAPTVSTDARDTGVDGYCPADLGYDLGQPTDQSESDNGWEVFATAQRGRNVLEWGEPPVSGVTGYIVARSSLAPDLSNSYGLGRTQVKVGSVFTFAVNGFSGGGEWADLSDIEPCTYYHYRVFPITSDGVGYPADPVEIRSLPQEFPDGAPVSPVPVEEYEVRPTTVGAWLTWELPDDPSRKGILVQVSTNYNGHPSFSVPAAVLPHDATSHMVLTRGFEIKPSHVYCYDVGIFNDFRAQPLGPKGACVSSTELVHCRMTTEEVLHASSGHLTIRFRGCEESSTQVVRRELTADGFQESRIDQPCAWMPSEYYNWGGTNRYEGILKCEYEDTSVKPGTWYVYELTQTYADGREFTSHHEIVTDPRVEMP